LYAVIKVGGKQERVKAGDVIEVEFMRVDPGSAVEFQPILVVDDQGRAHHGKELEKAKVVATLLGDKKGEKLRVFTYRSKSGYRRNMGHRQRLTLLEVQEVGLGTRRATKEAAEKAPEEAPEPEAAPARRPAAKKPAARKPGAKKPAARKPAAKKTTTRKKPTARKKPTGGSGRS
jgi:large subunit ribosomal protein L21